MKKKLFILLALILFLTGCSNKVEKVFDNVLDVGTYTKLDYNVQKKFNKNLYDNWGGCTAVQTIIDDNVIIGRNMDLTISDKSAYIFKTDIKDKYKTINLAYTHRDFAPDYDDAVNGLSDEFYKVLPFLSDDVLNEKGLYIELNMRNGEGDKFSCSGTNPDSDERIYMFSLPMYVGLNCATVDEALEYIKTLDIYNKKEYWNYAFMIADSTGRVGVLEIAQNKLLWNEGENVQTNFYVNKDMNKIEELKTGVGRYNYAKSHIKDIKTKDDMFSLMDTLKYSEVYNENVKWDVRSEFVGVEENWTYDYVMNSKNKDVTEYKNYLNELNKTVTREERKQMEAWESTFTEVVDLNAKTIKVRFFEDDSRIYTLSFEK